MSKRNGAASAKRSKTKASKIGADSLAKRCDEPQPHQGWFTWFAHITAHWAGKPAAFLIAFGLIVLWAVTGPLFGFSDTWQLVVNTATTIVTFLMVFLIQNTQNRDTMALQIKLADLIIAIRGTNNKMAIAEDMDDEDLEALHQEYRKRAEQAEASLRERHSSRAA
jgi:low affinity Fe/Cu permease